MMNKLWLYYDASSRRAMLPTELSKMWKCAVFLVGLLMISSTTGVVKAYEEPLDHWERKDSTGANINSEWIDVYIASSVGYFGAVWIPGREVYEYNFRISGVGEARNDDGDPRELCRIQAVQIAETVNKEHQAIWTSTDPKYIGAWPHSGTGADYSDAAYILVSMAISAISSYAGYALTAIELIDALLSASDEQQDGETVWREWYYSPDQTDVAHWFWWLHDVDPNQEVEFTVDDYLFGPSYEMISVGWTFVLTTPGPPDEMSEAEREMYGIEVIPITTLNERADELRITPETVEGLLKQGEPIYYAHNLPVVVIPHQPEPPLLS